MTTQKSKNLLVDRFVIIHSCCKNEIKRQILQLAKRLRDFLAALPKVSPISCFFPVIQGEKEISKVSGIYFLVILYVMTMMDLPQRKPTNRKKKTSKHAYLEHGQ
jgi:hypothetical protein